MCIASTFDVRQLLVNPDDGVPMETDSEAETLPGLPEGFGATPASPHTSDGSDSDSESTTEPPARRARLGYQVLVRGPAGTFICQVFDSDTVEFLKCQAAVSTHVPVVEQVLLVRGVAMDDAKTLGEYNLQHGDFITMTSRLRGGAFESKWDECFEGHEATNPGSGSAGALDRPVSQSDSSQASDVAVLVPEPPRLANPTNVVFSVFVRALNGKRYELLTTAQATFEELLDRTLDVMGWWMSRSSDCYLTFEGLPLEHKRRLEQYGLGAGYELEMRGRLRGGGDSQTADAGMHSRSPFGSRVVVVSSR